MTTPVLTALEGSPAEQPLVAAFGRPAAGVRVVRRCVDVAELLAAAASGSARAALVSADLRRFDGSVLARLTAAGVGVVGLAGSEDAERRLRSLGVTHVVAADAAPSDVAAALARSATTVLRGGSSGGGDGGGSALAGLDVELADPADALALLREAGLEDPDPDPDPGPSRGRVVAVWGPTGAPGRTLLATTLAAEAALLGVPTMLVDADTYGGAVAPMLGMLDDAPGLAAAARAANVGSLDVASLATHARAIRIERAAPLRVLTGLTRAGRWPEIRPTAVDRVLELARVLCSLVVVDCGFCLESDEELSYDTVAPRRNGVTLAVLAAADHVLAVGSADPVGLARLVRELPDLAEAAPGARRRVVVNRLRDGAVSGDPAREVHAALRRFAGVASPVLLPEDRAAADAALLAGRTLGEVAPRSAYRLAVRELAAGLTGTPVPQGKWRRVRTLAG